MHLKYKHIFTLSLDVETLKAHQIGSMPTGRRVIVPIKGGSFKGDRLQGVVESGGYDWVLFRQDGVMEIDVRLVLTTGGNELVYLNYKGRLIANSDVHARMAKQETIDATEYSLTVFANFETSATRLDWLNNVIAVGVGRQEGFQPTYEVYEIIG